MSKPKAPDTSGMKKQEQMLAEQDARLKKQEEAQSQAEKDRKAREAASKRARTGRSGGNSLLTGLETGVQPVDPTKRTQFG